MAVKIPIGITVSYECSELIEDRTIYFNIHRK